MKNVPERIYLDFSDLNDIEKCGEVFWSESNAAGDGIEYVRKDIAESELINILIEFADWYDKQTNIPESQNEKWMNESNAKSFFNQPKGVKRKENE